jgi:hypothetical protein
MTNVFKYDFAPIRAPPIGMPVLNLPGSFGVGDLAYQGGALIDWAFNNWLDILLLGFAAYGAMILVPRMFKTTVAFGKKFIKF